VAPKATKTEIKEAVQSDFQSKGGFGAHGELSGKRTAARQVHRLPSGLEESVRALEERRKDAGVRAEFVTAVSSQLSAVS
jgi:hypothetical protein